LTTDISRTIRRRSGFSRIAYAVVKEPTGLSARTRDTWWR